MLIRRSGAGRNGVSTAARESWALMSDSDNISSCDPKIAGSQNMQKTLEKVACLGRLLFN